MFRIDLDPLILRIGDSPVPHSGTAASGSPRGRIDGTAIVGNVTGPANVSIDIGLVTWATGGLELKALVNRRDFLDFTHAAARTTLFREPHDGRIVNWMIVEALAPQAENPHHWTAQKVNEDHLDWILGSRFADFAADHGALAFGTAEAIRGDASPSRNFLNLAFDDGNVVLPIATYAITRYLSMAKGFSKDRVES